MKLEPTKDGSIKTFKTSEVGETLRRGPKGPSYPRTDKLVFKDGKVWMGGTAPDVLEGGLRLRGIGQPLPKG